MVYSNHLIVDKTSSLKAETSIMTITEYTKPIMVKIDLVFSN